MDESTTENKASLSASDRWSDIKSHLRQALNEQTFNTWFGPVEFVRLENNALTLSVPDPFYADWIREHYQQLIKDAATTHGPNLEIHYVVKQSLPSATATFHHKSVPTTTTSLATGQQKDLNPNFTFDRFVIGAGNRFAHAAAIAVCEEPAKAYNPLFIYGQVGLGKTHLLQAIAHKMLHQHQNGKVAYLSSEHFTNLLINAIQNRSMARFRERFRVADFLLIDDIHFIAGKESTMEEFFHTFNTLYDAHKQIVVSSDRLPKDMPALEERLVSRFAWGLVTDIQPPNLETRMAILQSKLARNNSSLPQDVMYFIASNVKSNIRELEGAMVRVTAYSALTNTPITLGMAKEVLRDTVREEFGRISIEAIQNEVATHFHIKVSDMRARKRTKSVVFPRQLAMYLARELTDRSLLEVGQYFGGRDHSTVLHGCLKVERLMKKDSSFQEIVLGFIKRVKGG